MTSFTSHKTIFSFLFVPSRCSWQYGTKKGRKTDKLPMLVTSSMRQCSFFLLLKAHTHCNWFNNHFCSNCPWTVLYFNTTNKQINFPDSLHQRHTRRSETSTQHQCFTYFPNLKNQFRHAFNFTMNAVSSGRSSSFLLSCAERGRCNPPPFAPSPTSCLFPTLFLQPLGALALKGNLSRKIACIFPHQSVDRWTLTVAFPRSHIRSTDSPPPRYLSQPIL